MFNLMDENNDLSDKMIFGIGGFLLGASLAAIYMSRTEPVARPPQISGGLNPTDLLAMTGLPPQASNQIVGMLNSQITRVQ